MEIPKKIQDAIAHSKLVVFVGSGLSTKFNLPSWTKLVEDVINEIDKESFKTLIPVLQNGIMTPIEILEKIKTEHNVIIKYIKNNFKILNGDFTLHKNIFELTQQVITTNYDNAFEEATNNTINPSVYTSEFNISEINKNNDPYIFKLHGSYVEPDHCILFKEDYENLYSKESAAKEKLKSIFIEKTILFIGFSFNDPDINLIFENLDKVFGNNNRHFILTKECKNFAKFEFLEPIEISDYSQIDLFINDCLKLKKETNLKETLTIIEKNKKNEKSEKQYRIAILYPNPLDINFKGDLLKIINYFDGIDAELCIGTLNVKTLYSLDEFDIVVVISQVFKSKLYIEDENLKSNLISTDEILFNIPNDKIPIVFITNEKVEPVVGYPAIYISSFKNAIINKFIYKALKSGELDFKESEIIILLDKLIDGNINKGIAKITSIYNNNKNLEIGKKSLTNVIGRIEGQAIIALKLISIIKTNKLLNIKASGGTGKTTLIKKVAYELYNRGYYKAGVTFKSCESVKTFADFEEALIDGFNLTNILNFKDYLIENYSNNKIDSLIILDNFETVVNSLNKANLKEVIELLKFVTDFANIAVTSREKISLEEDFEDVYSLTPMITDDALTLFQDNYGLVNDNAEIRILRNDILEDLLNNNPLAIKLVTKSRTRFKHISELKEQLTEHFFESINEDYSIVFKNNADLNIERTKSIYQSINYSYATLNPKEKISFELLSLFPDGISLSNFKKCFDKSLSSNNISDKELRILRDKSLVEDYNGTLQLQPIIRRFAEYQFSKRPIEIKQKYCLDAYLFNCFVLDIIELIEKKKSLSEALKLYNPYKNNLLKVLSYIPEIELNEKGPVPQKKMLLNYIYSVEDYLLSEKQINEFIITLNQLESFFLDIPNAKTLINVLIHNKTYYHNEFDLSYLKLLDYLSVEDMENRIFSQEDYIERLFKNIISNIHGMEGYALQRINSYVKNESVSVLLDAHFFYLGIINNISRKKDGFYFFEYELILDRLDICQLEDYINSLYLEEHLEIMQSTYTLSKVKALDKKVIYKLVVTNPYTRGLKSLMLAFAEKDDDIKIRYFESALNNLLHIKYYYLESLYYYCLFLKSFNPVDYHIKLQEGIALSKKFHYQYLNYLFENIDIVPKPFYVFSYSFYPIPTLEEYVQKHNDYWEKIYKENKIG